MQYAMGTPILISHSLKRVRPDGCGSQLRIWARSAHDHPSRTYFVVGHRTYSDGVVRPGAYEARRRFPVYLVSCDLRKAPIPVLEEDLRPLWLSS